MGLLQRLGLKKPAGYQPPDVDETLGLPWLQSIAAEVDNTSVEQLWDAQPHLRTVTDFIARSVASISIHVYRRADDGGRERIREGDLARLMKKANRSQVMYNLLYSAVMDLCLYDEFIWVLSDDGDGLELYPVSPTWVQSCQWYDQWSMRSMTIIDKRTGQQVVIPAERIIRVHGYAPGSYKRGSSKVRALKDLLKEQLESAAYRGALWRNGPKISGVIERPLGAPKWEGADRRRFKASWRSQYSGRGSGVGGTPILEDGMTFSSMHLKASDEQIVDVAKLSLATVASVYQINPVMVGLLDNANYSNVREFRKSLYGDSLGPIIKQIEDTLNVFLLEKIGAEEGVYLEFNIDEKLRASFEEKAAVTSTAVGGPWMTRNEARAMNNMPAIEGGDELLVPLNTATDPQEINEPADPVEEDSDGS